MKQAILITAYKNYHHLEDIIAFFDEDFTIYIHIDKKSYIAEQELLSLKQYSNVKLISQKFKVNWGGFNHLRSILYLAEKALENPSNHYFHLISGHDFPIKPVSDFKFFFNNTNKEYINCFQISSSKWANNGTLDRLEYYNLYDLFNWKIDFHKRIIKKIIHWQKKIHFKRSMQLNASHLYGGSTWWSLSRECLNYVIQYSNKNNIFLNRFKYTLCSEEFYFQTILMNSNLKFVIII